MGVLRTVFIFLWALRGTRAALTAENLAHRHQDTGSCHRVPEYGQDPEHERRFRVTTDLWCSIDRHIPHLACQSHDTLYLGVSALAFP